MLLPLLAAAAAACPWDDLTARLGAPNVKWCEESLCAWVKEPANTWSNLAYVVVAAYLYFQQRGRSHPLPLLRHIPLAVLVMGTLSLVYHASVTYLLQVFDFFGMYLYLFIPMLLNGRRLGWIGPRRLTLYYWLAVIGATAAIPALRAVHFPYQTIVLFGIVLIGLSEALCAYRKVPGDRRQFGYAIGLLGLAAFASYADVSRLFCDPTSHLLQGHAVWHLLSALSVIPTVRFYATTRPPAEA